MNPEKNDALSAELQEKNERKMRVNRAAYSAGANTAGGKGRKWLFLMVDVLLLAAIVATVLFLISLLTPVTLFAPSTQEERTLTYVIEIAGVDKATADQIAKDNAVTELTSGSLIGTVVEVSDRAYEVYIDDYRYDTDLKTDMVQKVVYDEFVTLTVTVKVTAVYEAGVGYTAQDCRIAVGKQYDLRFPSYSGSGVCIGMYAE